MPMDDFWRLRGLIDAHGYAGAARLLGCTEAELLAAIYPGAAAPLLATILNALGKQAIAPFVRIHDQRWKEKVA
jgi:hypothetical protein